MWPLKKYRWLLSPSTNLKTTGVLCHVDKTFCAQLYFSSVIRIEATESTLFHFCYS